VWWDGLAGEECGGVAGLCSGMGWVRSMVVSMWVHGGMSVCICVWQQS